MSQTFDDIINKNEEIENTQIPTGTSGAIVLPEDVFDGTGGSTPSGSTPTGGYGGYLTGSSTPVVTPSRAAGAAPSGYADYLKGDGKGVAEGFDQAVAAARAEYERNRATFGARAESLGRAGLTGSGYGDYLEGKAFTAMQQKIGAAETAKAQSYADYLTQKEAQASSYAAYLSSEQQAEEEKVKTVANAIVYNARNKGVSSVTVESIILDAKAAGVTLTDEQLASIRADLESVGINVVTQAEASNESLYQTMVGYIEDGGPARTVDDLIAVIKTYDPNISDESARAIAERLVPKVTEVREGQLDTIVSSALAIASNGVVTKEQLALLADNSGAGVLNEEELQKITGDLSTMHIRVLSQEDWEDEIANTVPTLNSEQLEAYLGYKDAIFAKDDFDEPKIKSAYEAYNITQNMDTLGIPAYYIEQWRNAWNTAHPDMSFNYADYVEAETALPYDPHLGYKNKKTKSLNHNLMDLSLQ